MKNLFQGHSGARYSLVYSSMMMSILNALPEEVSAVTKSWLQRWCLFSWEIKGMEGLKKGFHNRRHPERTDYYRIIEGSFEEFESSYPELFEEKYGYLRREEVSKVI